MSVDIDRLRSLADTLVADNWSRERDAVPDMVEALLNEVGCHCAWCRVRADLLLTSAIISFAKRWERRN